MIESRLSAARERQPVIIACVLGLVGLALATGCDFRSAGARSQHVLELSWNANADETGDFYGLSVELRSRQRGRMQFIGGGALSAAGTFTFHGAPDGAVEVHWIDASGRWAPGVFSVPSPGEYSLDLNPGIVTRFELERADASPLAKATVTAWATGVPPVSIAVSGREALLPALPAGPLKLVVAAPGCRTRIVDLRLDQPSDPEGAVSLPKIALEKGGAELRVRFDRVDRALGSLEVWLAFGGAGMPARQEPGGVFRFAGLPPTGLRGGGGTLEGRLTVQQAGREIFSRAVTVGPDGLDLGLVELTGAD